MQLAALCDKEVTLYPFFLANNYALLCIDY